MEQILLYESVLRLPEEAILDALKMCGMEAGKINFSDGCVWVIAWHDYYYIGETLREAVRSVLENQR